MARSVNKVIIVGNLGNDPEIKTTPQGKKVATISIATSENYKDKAGEWQTITDWHRVNLWDYMAETCEKHLHKGSKVYVEGKLKTRSYEKDGITRYVTDIQASSLVLLDPSDNKGQYEGQSKASNNNFTNPSDQPETMRRPDEDDDIPF
jgi:single-strand DNA-binding protein